jgi:hypothetical protein
MKIFFMMTLCFTFNLANSQVVKTGTIEEVFKNELSIDNRSNDDLSLVTPSEVLPDWFFNPPQGDQDIFYAVGISDPWIDKARGTQQAKMRAFCIAGLMNNVTTKGVSDVYYKSDQTYKFEQITYFNSLPNVKLEGKAIDSTITKYGECVCQYKFLICKAAKKINSTIEYYKSVIKQDAGYSKQERFDLKSMIDDGTMKYNYTGVNKDFEIISIFNSDTITIKPVIYQYTQRITTKDIQSRDEISLFKKGLWQGFFKSFIDNLDITASEMTTKQKSLSDITHNTNGSENLNELNRGIYNTSFSFSISTIELTKKEMVIHFKTSNNKKQFQTINI